MDHADDGDDDDVFVYMGGGQIVPRNVTHVRVHKSVKIITRSAFRFCRHLVSIELHDGVEIIEAGAFYGCRSLVEIKLLGVRVIEKNAFAGCRALESVEFGDKLESIGERAFTDTSLRTIKQPKVRVIGYCAFRYCNQLVDVELSKDLGTIEDGAFYDCPRLRCIAMPLKDDMFDGGLFSGCGNLSAVHLVGGIHKTISSLLLESWKSEMNDEIECINRGLPNTPTNEKSRAIRQWMERVIQRIQHYKSEHYALLKKNMTQLELALWKANLHEEEDEKEQEERPAKKAKMEKPSSAAEIVDTKVQTVETARHHARVTCGANLILPHVLSFLNDEDVFPTQNHNS